jgi:hypothetical protein
MLDSTNPVNRARLQVNIDGRKLHRIISRLSAPRRALMAYEAEVGAVIISGLGRQQAARLFRVARGYIATVARLDAETRERLRVQPHLLTEFHHKRELSDATIDAFVARVGGDRVFAALDRATAPLPLAAE